MTIYYGKLYKYIGGSVPMDYFIPIKKYNSNAIYNYEYDCLVLPSTKTYKTNTFTAEDNIFLLREETIVRYSRRENENNYTKHMVAAERVVTQIEITL